MTEEQAKTCGEASSKELKTFVPQSKLDEVTAEKTKLEATVKEHATQLETLKKSKGDLDGLKAQIEALQTENKTREETHAQEMHNLKVDSAVETAILSSGGKNAKAVRALLELDNAQLNGDGAVVGLSEQMKKLQTAEDSKFLFADKNATPTLKGATPARGKDQSSGGEVDTSKMSYIEMCKYLEDNPDAQL